MAYPVLSYSETAGWLTEQEEDFQRLHVPVHPGTFPTFFDPPLRFHYKTEDGEKQLFQTSRPFWVRTEAQIVKLATGEKWKSYQGCVRAETSEIFRFLHYVLVWEEEQPDFPVEYVPVPDLGCIFGDFFVNHSTVPIQVLEALSGSDADDDDELEHDIIDELLWVSHGPETLNIVASIREERRKEEMNRVMRWQSSVAEAYSEGEQCLNLQ
ncbi:hypothetical protein DFS34DRAFT_653329 [Phlyctochytrium arcticum]|nr:hypothetical protein DFS34DRAFT_653329 [Phlyctochytrium arcticum]